MRRRSNRGSNHDLRSRKTWKTSSLTSIAMAKAAWKKETNVSMKQLDLVKAHLKKADEEHTVNDEMMVPIDMRVAEQDFDGPAQMLMKIGPRGCAEAYGATC